MLLYTETFAAVNAGASVEMCSALIVALYTVLASWHLSAGWAIVIALAPSRCLNERFVRLYAEIHRGGLRL